MERKERNTDIRGALNSSTVKTALHNKEKRENRQSKKSFNLNVTAKDAEDIVSSWSIKEWYLFLEHQLKKFDVPTDFLRKYSQTQKLGMLKNFVATGKESLGNAASLLVAYVNMIVCWEDNPFPYYATRPDTFHLGYIDKAWSTYKSKVEKNPSIVYRYEQHSEQIADIINGLIGNSTVIAWKPSLDRRAGTKLSFEEQVSISRESEDPEKRRLASIVDEIDELMEGEDL